MAEEVDKVKEEYGVNFKTSTLLSKPFLYDESTLQEQLVKEASTQWQLKQIGN